VVVTIAGGLQIIGDVSAADGNRSFERKESGGAVLAHKLRKG